MTQLKAFLDLFDPKVWDLAVGLVLFLVTYAIRRFAPRFWATVLAKNPAFAQLWLVVVGALISAAPALGKPMWNVVQDTILGAVMAALLPQGLHAFLKAIPIPYTGAQKQLAGFWPQPPPNAPPGR